MKLGTTVLISSIALFAGTAIAADITSPFYLPGSGKFLSDTSLEYNRVSTDIVDDSGVDISAQGWYAKEQLSYGVTDNFSVNAAIGNTFDNKTVSFYGEEFTYNNSHNFDYTVGAAYNYNVDKLLTQISFSYNTFKAQTFLGNQYAYKNWNEYATFGAKIGYSLGCDDFIPYIDFKATYGLRGFPYLEETYNTMGPVDGHWNYSTVVGAHKKWDFVSADLGVRWDNFRHDTYSSSQKSSRNDVYAQGSVNYFISDAMTVGLYGDYLIGATHMPRVKEDYTVGANFKVGF